MVRSIRNLTLFSAALLCTVAHAQDKALTPKDVSDGWVGKTAIGTTATGAPVELQLRADGTAAITAGTTKDVGTWRLSDAGFCLTWKSIRAGQERCYMGQVQASGVRLLNPDGTVAGQYTEFK